MGDMYVGAISSFSCTTFSSCIQEIYSWSFYIVGFAAFAMILFAGVVWFTSAGNASKISQARSYISNAILGLIILFSSYLILNTINPDLVKGTINFPLWGQSTTKITYPTSVPDYCPGLAEASPIPTKDGTLLSSSLKQKLLIVFNDKSHPLWWITEAIPETVSHQDPGHQKGYAVDIAFKTPTDATTGNIASMKASLEAQGLTVLDEYTNPSAGSTGGHLHVTGDDCTVSMAPPSPDCGNGILEPGKGESCDGNDLGNFTCQSIGMAGAPKCTNFCAFDFNACTGSGETGFRITTDSSLSDAKPGEVYSEHIVVEDGELPYEWSVAEGELPPGFSLNPSDSKSAYISGILTGVAKNQDSITESVFSFNIGKLIGGIFNFFSIENDSSKTATLLATNTSVCNSNGVCENGEYEGGACVGLGGDGVYCSGSTQCDNDCVCDNLGCRDKVAQATPAPSPNITPTPSNSSNSKSYRFKIRVKDKNGKIIEKWFTINVPGGSTGGGGTGGGGNTGNVGNTQCSDGIDNDGDGKIDFPDDWSCRTYKKNDESADFTIPTKEELDKIDIWYGGTDWNGKYEATPFEELNCGQTEKNPCEGGALPIIASPDIYREGVSNPNLLPIFNVKWNHVDRGGIYCSAPIGFGFDLGGSALGWGGSMNLGRLVSSSGVGKVTVELYVYYLPRSTLYGSIPERLLKRVEKNIWYKTSPQCQSIAPNITLECDNCGDSLSSFDLGKIFSLNIVIENSGGEFSRDPVSAQIKVYKYLNKLSFMGTPPTNDLGNASIWELVKENSFNKYGGIYNYTPTEAGAYAFEVIVDDLENKTSRSTWIRVK